jgi:opacity protein-like surface antigen
MRKWTTIAASACAILSAAPVAAQQAQTTTTTTTETTSRGQPITATDTREFSSSESDYGAEANVSPPARPRGMRQAIVELEDPGLEAAYLTPLGVSFAVGGGVTGMIESDARDMTATGGSWDARVTIGTRAIVGVELGYVGGAQDIAAIGLDSSAYLLRNSAEAVARLHILNGPVQPYILGGAGWTNFHLTGDSFNTSSVQNADNMAHFPVGAGVGFRLQGLVLDARSVFRPVAGDDMLEANGGRLHTWEAKGMAGWEF